MWEVEYTHEFEDWWHSLDVPDQRRIAAAVDVLEEKGPSTGRPLADTLESSRHSNMKELRLGTIRVLFAFDPRRVAILLIGGNKRGEWSEWYRLMIPVADRLYDDHLDELRREGVI